MMIAEIHGKISESGTEVKETQSQEFQKQKDSIFIVVNAAGERPDEANAIAGKELTEQRVKTGVDIQAFRRFSRAKKILRSGTRIAMHQGGSHNWRTRYGAGLLRAAGIVRAVGLPLTEEDKQGHDYRITKEFYPIKQLAGKTIYVFARGIAKQPLPKEDVPYNPRRGDNFIEIKPDDPRYAIVDEWWNMNY